MSTEEPQSTLGATFILIWTLGLPCAGHLLPIGWLCLITLIPFAVLLITYNQELIWLRRAQPTQGEVKAAFYDRKVGGTRDHYQIAYEHFGTSHTHSIDSEECWQEGDAIELLVDPRNASRVRLKAGANRWQNIDTFAVYASFFWALFNIPTTVVLWWIWLDQSLN